MSLAQLWAALRAARWSILLMVLVATSLAYVLVSGQPKAYTAKARVMLNIDNSDPTQYSNLQRNTEGAYIGTEIQLVSDSAVLRQVVASLGWPSDPTIITAWQAATGGAGDITAWAAGAIGRNVGARQLEDSSIIEILYTSTSLESAKQIVAAIRVAFIDQGLKLRVEAANRAATWNRTQATRALAVVRDAEAKRAAFIVANQIAVDTPAGGLDYTAQLAAMNSATGPLARATDVAADSPAVATLKRRLNALDAEIAVMRLQGEENPQTLALEAQRAAVTEQIARENAVDQSGGGATAAQIGLVRQQRDADYLTARLKLLDRAPLYDTLARMDRDVLLKTQRYQAAAHRVANFDAIAAAPSGARVIGDVIADSDPTFPNVPLTLAAAAGASLALGITVAIVGALVRRQVQGIEDLQLYASVPVLAVIADDPPRRARWLRRLMPWRSRRDSNPRYRLPSTAV